MLCADGLLWPGCGYRVCTWCDVVGVIVDGLGYGVLQYADGLRVVWLKGSGTGFVIQG